MYPKEVSFPTDDIDLLKLKEKQGLSQLIPEIEEPKTLAKLLLEENSDVRAIVAPGFVAATFYDLNLDPESKLGGAIMTIRAQTRFTGSLYPVNLDIGLLPIADEYGNNWREATFQVDQRYSGPLRMISNAVQHLAGSVTPEPELELQYGGKGGSTAELNVVAEARRRFRLPESSKAYNVGPGLEIAAKRLQALEVDSLVPVDWRGISSSDPYVTGSQVTCLVGPNLIKAIKFLGTELDNLYEQI